MSHFASEHLVDDRSKIGTYALSRLHSMLLFACRHTPLGRGRGKWIARDFILRNHGEIVDSTLYGSPARFYLRGNLCEWKAFVKPKSYDPLERKLVKRAMEKHDAVFIDIGANIGMYSISAAKDARLDARIIAFEPHPITFRRLQFNVKKLPLPLIQLYQVALGDRDGLTQLSTNDLSFSSVLNAGDGEGVPMRRLLTCLSELDVNHIDVLKIDVEGFEDYVLGDFLDNAPSNLIPKTVIIEDLARQNWKRDCIEMFEKRGMKIIGRKNNNTFLALV